MEINRRLGEQVLAYLVQLAEHYRQALAVASQLSCSFADQPQRELLLQRLQDRMVDINAFEQEHLVERQTLIDRTIRSAEIDGQLSAVRSLLERVLQAVDGAENAAVAVRAQLTPQLDERTKARQARAAYQRS
jgi:hypothetical protein